MDNDFIVLPAEGHQGRGYMTCIRVSEIITISQDPDTEEHCRISTEAAIYIKIIYPFHQLTEYLRSKHGLRFSSPPVAKGPEDVSKRPSDPIPGKY